MVDDYYADPAAYWRWSGQFMPPFAEASPEHERQEAALIEVLKDVTPASIFEAGCGGGRLANFFAQLLPDASYTAIDVGPSQLESTLKWRPDAKLSLSSLQDYEPQRGEAYDLVVVSEVLMHIPPPELGLALRNLTRLVGKGGRLLIIEWVPLPGELEANPTAAHNWPHDYEQAIGSELWGYDWRYEAQVRTDRQMIYLLSR